MCAAATTAELSSRVVATLVSVAPVAATPGAPQPEHIFSYREPAGKVLLLPLSDLPELVAAIAEKVVTAFPSEKGKARARIGAPAA